MSRKLTSTVVLLVELALCVSVWGPQPMGWLWVGSQANYATGSLSAGLGTAFAGTVLTVIATVWLAHRLDRWRRTRLVAAENAPAVALEAMFVTAALIAAALFVFWFFILEGPAPTLAPRV